MSKQSHECVVETLERIVSTASRRELLWLVGSLSILIGRAAVRILDLPEDPSTNS